MAETQSVVLLDSARRGDAQALEQLVERHREWLWAYVRRHMGEHLRRFEASEDVVQEALRRLLQQGPAFVPRDDDEFRRVVAVIVLNRLRDQHRWARVRGRELGGASLDADGAATRIGIAARTQDRPSQVVARNEEEALVRLALELLDPDDTAVLRLRSMEGLAFAAVGERLGIEPDAARMRFNRAMGRLGAMMARIEEGRLEELGGELDG